MRKGFTLIELLVVIAIIAILAAILFPVFAKAREKARQASCLSNLKQIALGCLSYAQDYDEYMPNSFKYETAPNTPPNGGLIWLCDLIYPYVKNSQIFNCPSVSSHAGVWNTPPLDVIWQPLIPTSDYVCPDWLGGQKLTAFVDPASTLFVLDAKGEFWAYDATDLNPTDVTWLGGGGGESVQVNKVHNDGFNTTFVDGHCKWLRQSTRAMWTTAMGH